MPRIRGAAIVIKDGKLLVLHRKKNGQEYYTFPGGGVENNETPEQAAERETLEETSVTCKAIREICINEFKGTVGHYMLCKHISGEPAPGNGEEYRHMTQDNLYDPVWINLDRLSEIVLYPIEVCEKIKYPAAS